ncbi:MAG TPA: SDR family oxidoreductase [Longimicrobium sp.]|nr:SDR family oxidoreductase [Longimicrobium sp.]
MAAQGTVLVLGADGMLGSMACRVLRARGWRVAATRRRGDADARVSADDPVERIEAVVREAGPVCVFNCIGQTRVDAASAQSVQDAFAVNGVFPWKLGFAARACGARVVHVSSDGVFRGRARPYTEASGCDAGDVYGLSKRAGEVSLPNVLSVRTSIVGPAAGGQGLLEWFLRHPDGAEVPGYANHVWNGVTTAQLADFFHALAAGAFDRVRARGPVVHFSPNQPLSKYELLREINAAYGRDVRVRPAQAPVAVTRVLSSRLRRLPGVPARRAHMSNALRELARMAPQEGKSR